MLLKDLGAVMTDTRRRVKLYALNAERQWDDKGTGHVSSSYVDRLKGVSLLVRAESDGNGSLLLESKIQPDTAYQKQQDTLIVWSEGDNFDLALSFQEKAGCDEIWERICQVQGKDPSVEVTQDIIEESEDERYEEVTEAVQSVDLPPCEVERLDDIKEVIASCVASAIRKEKLSDAIESENYIPKLLQLFNTCEDLNNVDALHSLYDIMRNIFLLNKSNLFEIMFSDDLIMDVIGCLEYDPVNPEPRRYRQHLKISSRYKEAVPITNPELLSKIHQTNRVQYIYDVVFPAPCLYEDNVLSALTSFLFFNRVEIVTLIQEDERFLPELMTQLMDENTSKEKRRDLTMFLREFCNYAQNLQPQGKENFHKVLNSMGVLSVLEVTLSVDDIETKNAAIDIFTYIVEYSPSLVREYILHQISTADENDLLLLNTIIEQIICDVDPDLCRAVQLMTNLRVLIDPENMVNTVNKAEKTEFLSYFYKHSINLLLAPLLSNTTGEVPSRDDYRTVQLLSNILELLTFCVEHHTYHIKNTVLNKDLVRHVLVLMRSKHRFLVLGSLRFVRRVVAVKDEFYYRYIVKNNLFKPVVDILLDNKGRYNLLDSAILELFEFIRVEDIKTLYTYIVESFEKVLENVQYVQTFKLMKQRYYQLQERYRDKSPLESVPSVMRPTRFRRDQRQMDEEEEMWFNEDDEFEDMENALVTSHNSAANLINKKLNNELDAIGKNIDKKTEAVALNKGGGVCQKSVPVINNVSSVNDSSEAEAKRISSEHLKRGLVDYEGGDSDDEEEEDSDGLTSSSPKRARFP